MAGPGHRPPGGVQGGKRCARPCGCAFIQSIIMVAALTGQGISCSTCMHILSCQSAEALPLLLCLVQAQLAAALTIAVPRHITIWLLPHTGAARAPPDSLLVFVYPWRPWRYAVNFLSACLPIFHATSQTLAAASPSPHHHLSIGHRMACCSCQERRGAAVAASRALPGISHQCNPAKSSQQCATCS